MSRNACLGKPFRREKADIAWRYSRLNQAKNKEARRAMMDTKKAGKPWAGSGLDGTKDEVTA